MIEITRERLHAFLDEALTEAEAAQVEQALRTNDDLNRQLSQAIQERDRGEHSLGAIWRRERLTCPTREQLGSYLLQTLEEDRQDYIRFHLETVACPYCQANLVDLQVLQREPTQSKERRKRLFKSSADFLNVRRDGGV